jgi:hypothetical protein
MHGWLSLPTVTDPLHFCNKTAATAHPISIIRRMHRPKSIKMKESFRKRSQESEKQAAKWMA